MAINNFQIPEGVTHWQEVQHPNKPAAMALLYAGGETRLVLEEQSSRPNFRAALRDLHQLPTFILTPSDYQEILGWAKASNIYRKN